eukprot:9121873-Karenia_brevis.AAC.1
MRPSAGQGEMEFALPIERSEVPTHTESGDRPFQRRDVYLKKSDFEKHGCTTGCPGCDSLRLGRVPRNHHAA